MLKDTCGVMVLSEIVKSPPRMRSVRYDSLVPDLLSSDDFFFLDYAKSIRG